MAQRPPVVTLFGCDRGPIDVLVEAPAEMAHKSVCRWRGSGRITTNTAMSVRQFQFVATLTGGRNKGGASGSGFSVDLPAISRISFWRRVRLEEGEDGSVFLGPATSELVRGMRRQCSSGPRVRVRLASRPHAESVPSTCKLV
jgi:hypothetical protein